MTKHQLFDLTTQPLLIDQRLQAHITRLEWLATCAALGILTASTLYHRLFDHIPWDYWTYAITAQGDFHVYYYAYWFVPIFSLLGRLPLLWGYYLWGIFNIIAVLFAARVFGGKSWLALVSFQLLYVLYFGNIIGIVIGGLALLWWALAHRRWDLAGLGLVIACTKYQIGIPVGLFLLWYAPLSWRQRVRLLAVPIIVSLASLLFYPGWPWQILEALENTPPNDWGSVSLWRWLGPWALLVWLPALFVRLPRPNRLAALLSATALGLPYFQQTDLLLLFVLPSGWLPLLGNLGYLFLIFRWQALQVLTLVPVTVYAAALAAARLPRWRPDSLEKSS